MHRVFWIDRNGIFQTHFQNVSGFDVTSSGFVVLPLDAVILDHELADRSGHPAILIAVIVDRTGLSYLPAYGNQFIKCSLVDQVAGVVLPVPKQIWRERLGAHGMGAQEFMHVFYLVESAGRELTQLGDKFLNG